MAAELLLNTWIDANLLLGLFVLLWIPVRRLLPLKGLRLAFIGQARALELVIVAVLLASVLPSLVSGLSVFETPTVSDMLLANFLSGNIDMSAVRFEALLGLRERLVEAFLLQDALWAQMLLAVLATGGVVHAIRFGRASLRLRGIVKRSHPWRRFGRLRLVISEEVRVPFSTCGLRNRYVILPVEVLAHNRDLHYALAHEFQHLRQFDLAYEIGLEALKPLFFLNPAFAVMCRQLRELREMSCDQQVAMRPHLDRSGYCRSLIRANERACRHGTVFFPVGPVVALVGAGDGSVLNSQLGRRIFALTDCPSSTGGQRTWRLIGLALCILLLSGAVVMRSSSGWSHDRIMLSTIVNLERLGERNATSQE